MKGAARIPHQCKTIGLQGALQQENRLIWRDGGTSCQCDRALQRGVHHVVDFENVTHHGAYHLSDGRFFKAEGYRRTREGREGLGRGNDLAIAPDDARL